MMQEVKEYFYARHRPHLVPNHLKHVDPIMILSAAAIFLRREAESPYIDHLDSTKEELRTLRNTVYNFIKFLAKNEDFIEGTGQLDLYEARDYERCEKEYPYLIDEDEGLYTGNVDRARTLLEMFGKTINWDIISLSEIRMEYEILMIELSPWADAEFSDINNP